MIPSRRSRLSLAAEIGEDPVPTTDRAPLVLFWGNLEPRQRIEALIAGFHVFERYLSRGAHCFIMGSGDHQDVIGYKADLRKYVRQLGLAQLRLLEYPTRHQLVGVLQRADVFVTLASHSPELEPTLTAATLHIPIVASETAEHRALLGGAAWYLDDLSPTHVAEAIHEVMTNAALHGSLRTAGAARTRDSGSTH